MLSETLGRGLSMSRFVQHIFAIKNRSSRETEQMSKFLGPQFFYGRHNTNGILLARPTSTIWQSLVEFRLLISVCEAWQ